MPILVICSGCSAKLNAPDTVAGKRIKCPKCQAVCAVPAPPAFEGVDEPEPPAAKPAAKAADDEDDRPRAKKRADEDDDRPRKKTKAAREEDEEEDEDRPRRKKKAAEEGDEPPRKRREKRDGEKAGGAAGLLIVGGILAGVLVLGGVAFATYWFGFRGKSGGNGPAPEVVKLDDWEEYSSPAGVFKASFPGKPAAREWKPLGGDFKVTSDIREYRTGETTLGKPSLSFFAGYVRFPNNVRPGEVADAKKWLTTFHAAPVEFTGAGKTTKKVTAGDREWDEDRMRVARGKNPESVGVVRWHLAGPTLHLVGYRSENQTPAADAVEKFFASHQVLGGDPGDPDPDPVKLDNWQTYTSPDGAFKASFPGETKKLSNFFFEGAKAAEFREWTLKDDRGRSRTYFAGFARFGGPPIPGQIHAVTDFARREALGGSPTTTGRRRVAVGGWPWGEELQVDADRDPTKSGVNGIVRWVVAGSSVYALGIKAPRFPGDKEIDQFFGSFEVLGAKPGESDLRMPYDWAEYRPPGGEFRTAMPRSVHQPLANPATAKQYGGVPIASLAIYKASDPGAALTVCVVRFLPDTPEANRQKVVDLLAKLEAQAVTATSDTSKKVTWAGRDAVERTYPVPKPPVVRLTHDAAVGCVAIATFDTPNPDIARLFLDSFSFDKDAPPLNPSKPEPPPGWFVHKPANAGFRALMPGQKGITVGDFKPSGVPAQLKAIASVRRSRATEGENIYTVLAVRFVPGATAEERQTAMNALAAPVVLTPAQAKIDARNKITWGGRDALEHAYTPADLCVCRQTHTETVGYAAVVQVQTGKLDPEKAKVFLNSFTFDE